MSGTRAHLSAPRYAEHVVWARSVVPDGLPLVGEDKQGMELSAWIHTPILLHFAPISFVSPKPVAPPRVDVHRGERHHAAGSRAWV
jgi:hypothetical protein